MILHRLLPDPGDVEIRPGRFCFFSPNAVPVHDGRNASSIDDDGRAWTASPPQDFGKPKHFGSKEP